MNPHDYKTWTSFADHPIFSDRKLTVTEWSSDPSMYDGIGSAFMVDWYVHQDPQLPTDIQAEYAKRDIRNLADTCAAIEREFGAIQYELFILDDFTGFVSVASSRFKIDLYPDNLSNEEHVLSLFIDSPDIEDSEHHLSDIAELVPTLLTVLAQPERRTT